MRSNSVQMMQYVKFNLQFHNQLFCSKYRGVDRYPVIESAQTSPSSHNKVISYANFNLRGRYNRE